MRRLPASRNDQRAFTLIEILVVLFVIGVVTAFAIPQFLTVSDDRDLAREGRRLTALLTLAADEAALQGRELGIRFSRTQYAFYDLDPETRAWVELPDDGNLKPRALPEGRDFEFALWVENDELDLDVDLYDYQRGERRETDADADPDDPENAVVAPPPHVVILSSGETTPFELYIADPYADVEVAVSADAWAAFEFHANTDELQ
ncbi:MAG: type II secretion system minor pseudopilin GspH [Pseudomonadota bacterium]